MGEKIEDGATITIPVKEYQKLKHDSEKLSSVVKDRRKLAVLNNKLTKALADIDKIMDNLGIPKEMRKFDD